MKKLIYVMAISGAIFSLQACGNNSSNSTETTDTSVVAADTTMASTSVQADTGLTDTAFANKAAISGMAEVELGKLALEKAKDAKVKDFASMMVKDHGKANEELKAIAKAKNMTLPTSLDQEHQTKLEELRSKSGADFDKSYAAAMVEGHQKTLALMEQGSNLQNAELRGFAGKTSPVVKHHLDMINSIQAQLK
jgi:putative membrane protein